MDLFYIKMVIRNCWKNKLFSIVNCIGLSVSFTLIFFLFTYVSTEKNVDRFHKNEDRIYRVLRNNECAFSPPFGQYIVDNIEGVENFCRVFIIEATLKSDYNLLISPNCYYADSNFFEVFSFPLLQGQPQDVLESRNNIVLSESFSKKLFPHEDPIGKKIRFNNRLDYFVTGVFKDFSENTHFKQADVIFPYIAFADFMGSNDFLNQYDAHYFLPALYVIANNKTDLSNKGGTLYNKAKSWYWLFQEVGSRNTQFQSLGNIYLNRAEYGFTSGAREGSKKLIAFFILIVFAILLVAMVNFLNLTLTYALKRTGEVGIKKTFGARKSQIVVQSLLETAFLFLSSIFLSIILLMFSVTLFNNLVGYHSEIRQLISNGQWKLILPLMLIFYSVCAIIPAFILSKFTPAIQKTSNTNRLKHMQQAFVLFQFTISVILMASMLVIMKQNTFLRNYNPGFNKEETIYIKLNSEIKNQKLLFKEELKKITGVESVSLCNGMPGEGIFNIRFEANSQTQNMDFLNVDDEYFRTMGISLKNPILPNPNSCWINESAARALAFSKKGKLIEITEYGESEHYWVNEILPDMNFHSLYEKTRPTIFTKLNTEGWVDYALLRVNTSQIKKVLNNAEKVYKSFSPDFPFNYTFLNDKLIQAYEKEFRTSNIITWFSIFAIFISSLGIFTLSVFSSTCRTKEIGIRKVNGAHIPEVMYMLNKDFIKWVAIAFVIACPIARYAMHKWLENFAYKTELSWWVFVAAGVIAMMIALLTVSWQSWRAATRNPVKSLRYE